MARRLMGILLLLCSLCGVGAAEDSDALGMVTGPATGTQIQFGRDIAGVAKTVGLDILVKESQGSIDNIKRMDSQENAALGIVYADVLNYLSRSEKPEMRQIASRLRLIFPLYPAEAHLLARRSIQTLGDLQGQRVVAGESGSGTWLTTLNLLQLTGVKPAELLNISQLQGVTAVLKGEADAMFLVAGKPVSLFTKVGNLIDKPEFAPLLANVHFVPLNDPRLLREYSPATIGPADYHWMTGDVPTIAVKAVLMSFDFSSRQSPYFAQRCRQLATLGQAIRANLGPLRKTGHPKWKDVNLDEAVGIWQLDRCSRSGKASSGANIDIDSALEKLLRN